MVQHEQSAATLTLTVWMVKIDPAAWRFWFTEFVTESQTNMLWALRWVWNSAGSVQAAETSQTCSQRVQKVKGSLCWWLQDLLDYLPKPNISYDHQDICLLLSVLDFTGFSLLLQLYGVKFENCNKTLLKLELTAVGSFWRSRFWIKWTGFEWSRCCGGGSGWGQVRFRWRFPCKENKHHKGPWRQFAITSRMKHAVNGAIPAPLYLVGLPMIPPVSSADWTISMSRILNTVLKIWTHEPSGVTARMQVNDAGEKTRREQSKVIPAIWQGGGHRSL